MIYDLDSRNKLTHEDSPRGDDVQKYWLGATHYVLVTVEIGPTAEANGQNVDN